MQAVVTRSLRPLVLERVPYRSLDGVFGFLMEGDPVNRPSSPLPILLRLIRTEMLPLDAGVQETPSFLFPGLLFFRPWQVDTSRGFTLIALGPGSSLAVSWPAFLFAFWCSECLAYCSAFVSSRSQLLVRTPTLLVCCSFFKLVFELVLIHLLTCVDVRPTARRQHFFSFNPSVGLSFRRFHPDVFCFLPFSFLSRDIPPNGDYFRPSFVFSLSFLFEYSPCFPLRCV